MKDVAALEWEKIRTSLRLCGDIGPFEEAHITQGDGFEQEEVADFWQNLADFAETVEEHGYGTLEAMGVYCLLVRLAVRRLGLSGAIATAFANGYSYIRTGWALDTDTSIEQNLFYKMFFQSREDHGWEFDSPTVQERLKLIFDKFMSWEQDRLYYHDELDSYREMKQEEAEDAD